ncbi:MAG: nucleotide sugar dehydrogenase [Deltaproteobacteria bacterium]|nr:nucleotide sugar dehydrogenase [Deltaproteobacteria bacterium]
MHQAAQLEQKIEAGKAQVGVLGLGYVGLPVALSFAESGLTVLGFDIDAAKVEQLCAGSCYVRHLAEGRLQEALDSERFVPTSDFSRLGEADVVIICVPTPLDAYRQPDLSYVEATARQIAETLRPGQLIILESTTYPGTTDELVVPTLAAGGLVCGEDFFVAFSPEREDPGNESFSTTDIPKVVGGVSEQAGDLAEKFYLRAFSRVHRVSSAREAEATKLMENIFRAVNIALVNELKVVYDSMGIDVWEVLDAADTKPFGFMRFNPGPGWGGHCIPVDPFYLSWKAREFGSTPRFIELAGQVNIEMPQFVIHKLQLALNDRTKSVRGSRILILGLAYKKDIDDPRESPAFEVVDLLLKLGANVTYHDPYVPEAPAMRSWPDLPPMTSQALTDEALQQADAVVLITDHKAVDYERVARQAPLIIDTRGVFPKGASNVVRA